MKLFMANDPHRDCWELLPWVANERISSTDAARIQAHLQACERCQAEVALQRRLREVMRSEDSLVIAPQSSFQKLLQRIEDEQRSCEPVQEVPPQSTKPIGAPIPRWFAIAASVQAVVIALLLSLLWAQKQERMTEPRYSTLTSAATVPSGPVIRVVLREQVTMGDLNALLRSLEASIVGGPNTAGVLTLQLSESRRTNQDVEAVAAQLRSDPRVLFSEPAVAELTRR